jgi:hypothetical protein
MQPRARHTATQPGAHRRMAIPRGVRTNLTSGAAELDQLIATLTTARRHAPGTSRPSPEPPQGTNSAESRPADPTCSPSWQASCPGSARVTWMRRGCGPRPASASRRAPIRTSSRNGYVDELPLAKRLVAHPAGVLRIQQAVELLLSQSVARNPVLPVGVLAGLRRLAMRVVSAVQPVALHGLGCLARASMPRSTGTCRLLSRHPLAAPLLPHSGKVYLRLFGFGLRHAESSVRKLWAQ